MKKAKRFVLVFFSVLLGTSLVVCMIYKVVFAAQQFLASSSPAGTYTVLLSGRPERPRVPAVVNSVWFRVVKGHDAFIGERYLHSGDWLDPSFSILYPNHTWTTENTLHFYREEYFQRGGPCKVVIENNSSRLIKYLKVTSDDTYLLFDLQPKSKSRVNISPARGSIIFISAEGEFSEGASIQKTGENFRIQNCSDEPISFYINIVGAVPQIESPRFQKYEMQ
jgi:hypothetical protein